MSSNQPPYGGQNSHSPSGSCAFIASTGDQRSPTQKRHIFPARKTDRFWCLQGISPDPLILLRNEAITLSRQRQYAHKHPPYGGIRGKDMNMKKNRTRNNKFTLYLSDDEMRILNAKTKLLGMNSKAQLLRQLLIEEKLYVVDYKELHDYNIQLGRIGTNINQIAHRINETRSIYQTDINEIKKEMAKIWQLQKSMLSKQPLREQ